MKKTILTFFTILLLIPFVSAQLEIDLSKSYVEVFSEETETIELTIRNLQTKTDTFLINILPPVPQGKVSVYPQQNSIEINANSSASVKIYLSADPAAEQTGSPILFNLTVSSLTQPSIQTSKEIKVLVLRKAPIFIKEMKVEKNVYDPSETVRIITTIQNTADRPCEEYILETIIEKEKEIVKTFRESVVNIPAKSTKDFVFEYVLGKYAPYGNYFVTSTLKDKSNVKLYEKSSSFTVRAISKIPSEYTEKKTEIKLLAVYVTIKVKNEGNVYVGVLLPSNIKLLSKFGTVKPFSVKTKEKGTALMWKFDLLKGREEAVLVYTAKPLADIKKLELPKAKMMYVSKGEKKIILSRNFTK
jgi:hypothetical protein